MLLAVNFHYIRESQLPYEGIHPVTPEQFEHQLDVLGRAFSFVGQQDILGALDGVRVLPELACIITFDDGLLEQYESAWRILERKGIPALFFVNPSTALDGRVLLVHKIQWLRATQPPDRFWQMIVGESERLAIRLPLDKMPPSERLATQYRYDSPQARRVKYLLNHLLPPTSLSTIIDRCFDAWAGSEKDFARGFYMQVDHWRKLSRAGCLGTHTISHLPLAEQDQVTMRREIADSKAMIEASVGEPIWAVSYPYGGATAISPTVEMICVQSGLRFGFTMERAFNQTLHRPLLLARVATNDAPGGSKPLFELADDGRTVIRLSDELGRERATWFNERAPTEVQSHA